MLERSYRLGSTGPEVAEIRVRLTALGLLDDTTDGFQDPGTAVFDEAVDRAVRAFQQRRGIISDGIVGPVTFRALEEARWRLGDRILHYSLNHPLTGDDVAALQQRLLDFGFDSGRMDGVFGADTENALRDFQRNVGLPSDGTAGPLTFKALTQLTRTVRGGSPQAMREAERIHRAGPALTGKVLVVDPGHGGTDRGATGLGLQESRVVHDLATRIEGRLNALGGFAFLTRGVDGNPSDADRAGFANGAEADLLISLHCDRHDNPEANGVSTYHYGNDRYGHFSAMGTEFAGLVQREIVARTDLQDCRTHAKTWDLLRYTRMPAVRIELGYVTNPGDAARLADATFRDTIAEAVVVAVQRLYLPAEQDTDTGFLRLPHAPQALRR
jgi:N-acetylmuramoyl-L-alanine amidase